GLMAFDAVSREVCTVKRVRTNTPLQALALLNDEAVMEMARALSRRVFAEFPGQLNEQLAAAFRLCTSRRPSPKELDRLTALYREQFELYNRDLTAAMTVLGPQGFKGSPPHLAAWTIVAGVLLNLDETMTKE
ncbi:MAG TPA: DUF1553 domain-containing protein, partial [Blastocatellia bacterium]|nr:DUF1553 domain-containing protein [Blastocatellia bacterium]